ncbi:hypothetical protein [Acidipila sp. EB88]|uniref:hypothetical protein n=1 Tax=Acidipila sp. EB88 TaxID=2305226 RepID=UPI000FBA4D30|nr:hypothetical protein [Acidipila sp. EB88]RRA48784.1 hypothetical protein D1Y84_11305 [Acidipila sp. EB88]
MRVKLISTTNCNYKMRVVRKGIPGIESCMAKGWESKSVEEQVADQENAVEARRLAQFTSTRERGDLLRNRQSLELQKEQILNQRTSNPHRRAALVAALAHVEEQLAAIGPIV